MNQVLSLATRSVLTLVTAAGTHTEIRFLEFFAANIRNPHTRRAYGRAVSDFLAWCADTAHVPSIAAVRPLHVSAWIEMQTRQLSAPTVNQPLAAVRHLFDWLVTGRVVPVNQIWKLAHVCPKKRLSCYTLKPINAYTGIVMLGETTRWTVSVSKDTDIAVRSFLAQRGMKKGDLSKFIEEAVKWRVLDQTIAEARGKFADMPSEALEATLSEAVAAARIHAPKLG